MSNILQSSAYFYIIGIRESDNVEIKLPKINKFESIGEARAVFITDYKDFIKHYGLTKFKIVKETKVLSGCGTFDLDGNEVEVVA